MKACPTPLVPEREKVYLPNTIKKYYTSVATIDRLPVEALAHHSWPPIAKKKFTARHM